MTTSKRTPVIDLVTESERARRLERSRDVVRLLGELSDIAGSENDHDLEVRFGPMTWALIEAHVEASTGESGSFESATFRVGAMVVTVRPM